MRHRKHGMDIAKGHVGELERNKGAFRRIEQHTLCKTCSEKDELARHTVGKFKQEISRVFRVPYGLKGALRQEESVTRSSLMYAEEADQKISTQVSQLEDTAKPRHKGEVTTQR